MAGSDTKISLSIIAFPGCGDSAFLFFHLFFKHAVKFEFYHHLCLFPGANSSADPVTGVSFLTPSIRPSLGCIPAGAVGMLEWDWGRLVLPPQMSLSLQMSLPGQWLQLRCLLGVGTAR